MWALLLGALLVLLVILYRRATRHYGTLEELGIPVVKPFLCFGSTPVNYHQLKFHELHMKWYHELGKPKVWGYYEGSKPTLAVIDPSIIKNVFVKQFDSFRERINPQFVIPHKFLHLVVSSGEEWKSLRKFLSSTFTTGRIKKMVQPIEHQVDQLIHLVRGKIGESAR